MTEVPINQEYKKMAVLIHALFPCRWCHDRLMVEEKQYHAADKLYWARGGQADFEPDWYCIECIQSECLVFNLHTGSLAQWLGSKM